MTIKPLSGMLGAMKRQPPTRPATPSPRRQRWLFAGLGPEERMRYDKIVRSVRRSGRYPGQEEEIAARTVWKHHRAAGHRTGE